MGRLVRIVGRIEGLWDLFDLASRVLAAAPIAAIAVSAWLKVIGKWGQSETSVPNWLLAGFVVGIIGILISIVLRFVLAFRMSKTPPFNFYEESLQHLWRLNIAPYIWIENDIDHGYSPEYVSSIISGPFHARNGCSAPLYASNDNQTALVVLGHCDRCNQDTPLGKLDRKLDVARLKLGVLRELQRIHRNGEIICRNMNISIISKQ